MIVFGSSLSPYVRKTMACAAEKGIEVELQPINPMQPSAEFSAASPFRKMPALQHGDFNLCDSSAIIHYFEAVKPSPALIPTEAKARGKAIWFDEYADTILVAAAGKMFFNRIIAPRFFGRPGDEEVAAKAEAEELPPVIDYLESVIPTSGHLVGDALTLADLAVASPFANLRHLGWRPDPARWPKTAAFADAMLARPSFAPMVAGEAAFLGT